MLLALLHSYAVGWRMSGAACVPNASTVLFAVCMCCTTAACGSRRTHAMPLPSQVTFKMTAPPPLQVLHHDRVLLNVRIARSCCDECLYLSAPAGAAPRPRAVQCAQWLGRGQVPVGAAKVSTFALLCVMPGCAWLWHTQAGKLSRGAGASVAVLSALRLPPSHRTASLPCVLLQLQCPAGRM